MSSNDARVLVVGGAGMLGHKLWQVLRQRFDTWTTVRRPAAPSIPIFADSRVITNVDAEDLSAIRRACEMARPDVVVNCVGLVKQLQAAAEPIPAISLNALFPHRLAAEAGRIGARIIHISTDCVFSGSRGHYSEDDRSDADDLYGRTKYLGEIDGDNRLTLRTSIIGREIAGAHGLVEWFLSRRRGRVRGYTQARFSGVTTTVLSTLIGDIIATQPGLSGLYQVAAEPISKYDLLVRLNRAFAAGVTIDPDDTVRIDRTLDVSRFSAATGFVAPAWDDMVQALADDESDYDNWRQTGV